MPCGDGTSVALATIVSVRVMRDGDPRLPARWAYVNVSCRGRASQCTLVSSDIARLEALVGPIEQSAGRSIWVQFYGDGTRTVSVSATFLGIPNADVVGPGPGKE